MAISFFPRNEKEVSRIKKIFFFFFKRQIYRKLVKTILFRCLPDNSFCFVIDHKHKNFKRIKEFMNTKQMNFCLFNVKKGAFFDFCPKIFKYGGKNNSGKKYRNHSDFLDSYICLFDGFSNLINWDKISVLVFLTWDNFVGNQLSFHLVSKRIFTNVLFSKKIFCKLIISFKKSFLKMQHIYKSRKTFFSYFLQNFFIFFFKHF